MLLTRLCVILFLIVASAQNTRDDELESLLDSYSSGPSAGSAEIAAAIVELAETQLAAGNKQAAAEAGLHLYLSSTTEPLRRRSLVLLTMGESEQAETRLRHIFEGLLDAQFASLVESLAVLRGFSIPKQLPSP